MKIHRLFRDRDDAGRHLAAHLIDLAGKRDVVVLALSRGGVPVGHRVAKELKVPLDIFVARKLGVPPAVLANATVILVDDGIATGSTMAAAIDAVRKRGVAEVIVASPVISREALAMLRRLADRCECVIAPQEFGSVGAWYRDFAQTPDAELPPVMT